MSETTKRWQTHSKTQSGAGSTLAVIPTLNEEKHIETCIRSLLTGDRGLQDVRLIVADGGSKDRTVEIVKQLSTEFPNITLLDNPKQLQSAALNLAVKEYATDGILWLVRCDAHSIYPENFILDVTRSLMRTEAASVVIPMDAIGQTCFEKANAWIVDTPLGSGGAKHRGGAVSGYVDHGHHAGFAISAFRAIGGYDESFSHNEDAEYDYRQAEAGGQIYMDADIRIHYIPRGSVRRLARQYFSYGAGRARTVAKHKMRLKLRQAIPILALVGSLIGLAASPFIAWSLVAPAGYLSLLLATSIFVAFQKRSLCGLFAGPASGTMHMSWAAGFLYQTVFRRGN